MQPLQVSVSVRVHVCAHVCKCVCVHMYASVCVCVHVYVSVCATGCSPQSLCTSFLRQGLSLNLESIRLD